MPLPKVTTPLQGTIHNHMNNAQKTFIWDRGNPAINPVSWRLKVGGTPGSGGYFTGTTAGANVQMTVTLNPMPPTGKTVYALVEWNFNGGPNYPNQGDVINFTCNP